MLLTPELATSIEALYQVFRRYELRSSTNPCPCCHSTQDEQSVRHKPLNKLSSRDMQQYAMDAIYTWGTGDDFKHFLPRLFELLVTAGEDFIDAAAVFAKLNYESSCSGRWRTWPEDEQKAVSTYLQVAWEAVLNSDPGDLPFDGAYGWIQAIAQAEHDLSKYLAVWLVAESPNAYRNLALMISNEGVPNATRPPDGYWGGHNEQWEQLKEWTRRPEVKQKLTNGFERWSDSSFAGELMDAVVLLPF
jgi:hypothetical protein